MELAELLKDSRRAHGMKSKDLAVAMDVSPATVSAWEHGHRNPPPGKLVQLASILDLDEEDIRKATGREMPGPSIEQIVREIVATDKLSIRGKRSVVEVLRVWARDYEREQELDELLKVKGVE